MAKANYKERRQQVADIQNKQRKEGRDISPIPPVEDIERRKETAHCLRLHCETYYPEVFYLPWSDDQLELIEDLQDIILNGGKKATAHPRGGGKTTICAASQRWASMNGYRRFPVLIGATGSHAKDELIETNKVTLETSDELFADYPEVCYPIRALEGIANRCKGQLCRGGRTGIQWRNDRVKLAALPDEELKQAGVPLDMNGCGSIMTAMGLTGRVRGTKVKLADGTELRPDFAFIDDPQTTESANSGVQTQYRIKLIKRDVLGMAGPGKTISVMMPCTVIAQGDLADQMTDRKLNPEWRGQRCKLVYSFPDNMNLWDKYAEIMRGEGDYVENRKKATQFYKENQVKMDKGAEVAWAERHLPDELSALQNAMNWKIEDEEGFFAEGQNDPMPEDDGMGDFAAADSDLVMSKINNRPRYEVPERCETLTAYVDVHDELLFYVVCAWQDDFTGFVVDYGTWPEQGNNYFTLQNARKTMSDIYDSSTKEGRIYSGLIDLFSAIVKREWMRADGEPMHIEVLAPDQRYKTDYVMRACKEHPHSDRLQPAFGQYIGARHKPIEQYERGGRNRGDKIGTGWILKRRMPDNPMRSLLIDANRWKTFVHERIKLNVGEPGGITLFGDNAQRHRLFGEHVAAEYGVKTEGQGRELIEWKAPPSGGSTQNHWFDCLVGCACLASFCGVGGGKGGRQEKRERVSMADYAKGAR